MYKDQNKDHLCMTHFVVFLSQVGFTCNSSPVSLDSFLSLSLALSSPSPTGTSPSCTIPVRLASPIGLSGTRSEGSLPSWSYVQYKQHRHKPLIHAKDTAIHVYTLFYSKDLWTRLSKPEASIKSPITSRPLPL